ncbi:MAG TPA: biopolymer transporter ExbD [Chitinophagaceae bacterium]
MTEINTSSLNRRVKGFGRAKRHNLKVDMTPMVDLGFILITFFVMTVQLTKPVSVNLYMPKDGDPTPLGRSNALTVLLSGNDRIYYYHGDWNEALANNEIHTTNFSVKDGLGKMIREKQKWLDTQNKTEGRRGLMLLIKPGKEAAYKNVIDALDEALINAVKKYTVLSAGNEEEEWLKGKRN